MQSDCIRLTLLLLLQPKCRIRVINDGHRAEVYVKFIFVNVSELTSPANDAD